MGRCLNPVRLILGDPPPGLEIRLDPAPCGLALELEPVQRVEVPVASEDTYEGPYTVVPTFEAQELHTADKVMTGNVSVEEIPVRITSNTAGGKTMYIGLEGT